MSDLPRAKGARPTFLRDPVSDDLLAIVMALAQELAVVRERCDTTERLLVARGVLGERDIEAFVPDRHTDDAREQWRRDYLDRVLFALKARADQVAAGETLDEYLKSVDAIGAAGRPAQNFLTE